jgi:hypothetical protein
MISPARASLLILNLSLTGAILVLPFETVTVAMRERRKL